MTRAEFTPADRAAVLTATDHGCAGCGQRDGLNVHHRVPRGMGGARARMTPAHGLALCGSGTTGCHGWAESYRSIARTLGWLVPSGADPRAVPFWTVVGWRAWVEDEGCWLVRIVDRTELRPAQLAAAVVAANR